MFRILIIAIGGAIGALLRYMVSGITHRHMGSNFPWGTLSVNLIGSFIIGFLWVPFERLAISPNLKMLVFIGILGAFTTFSTYSIETLNLLRDGEVRLALSNILLNNILGIALVFFGFISSRYLLNLFR